MVGSTVVHGVARAARTGAVCVDDDGQSFHVRGLSVWPDLLDGQRVVVLGTMAKADGFMDDAPGDFIDDARWLPAPPWTVRFADGSGNNYWFSMDAESQSGLADWAFVPVPPAQAPMGGHTGGVKAKGSASLAAAADAWVALLRLLQSDTTSPHRDMLHGAVTVTTEAGKRELVARPCAALCAFQNALDALRFSVVPHPEMTPADIRR